MGVDIHPRSLSLLKELFKVGKIVSRNEDSRIFSYSDIHHRYLRVAVLGCIACIKKRHCRDPVLSGSESKGYKVISPEAVVQECGQCFIDELVNVSIFLPKVERMFRISSHAFQTISYHFPEGADILVFCSKNSD